jgi:hypothetical protein
VAVAELFAVSSLGTAAIGLAGSLIGGAIAGVVSLLVARQAREAAEHAWIRDSRRQIYDRFLTSAQRLLIACEARDETLDAGYTSFFEAYGTIQTVAELPVVEAARVYAYRLAELKQLIDGHSVLQPAHADRVAQLVRAARHATIDAMRADLGLAGSARPQGAYNPFEGTDLQAVYETGRR